MTETDSVTSNGVTKSGVDCIDILILLLKPDLHETNFSREANFSPGIFACEFTANSKFNFHWKNFFCEFAANNAKEHGICSKIVGI